LHKSKPGTTHELKAARKSREEETRPAAGAEESEVRNPSTRKKSWEAGRRRQKKTLGKTNGGWLRDEDTAGELKRKIKPGPDLAERKPSGAGGGALSGGAKTREPWRASGGNTRKISGARQRASGRSKP
jgi:hypothetical protein